jgi:hypothetical protein
MQDISDTGLEIIRALNCLNNFDKGTVTGIKAGKFQNLLSTQIFIMIDVRLQAELEESKQEIR